MTGTLIKTRSRIRQMLEAPGVQEGILIIALILALALASNTILESWRYFIAVIVVAGSVLLLLINVRLALLLFIVFLGAYEEFVLSSSAAFLSEGIQGSILAVRVAGLGLLDFCLVMFLVPVLVRVWYRNRYHGEPVLKPYDALIFPFVAIWLYGIVLGLFHMHTFSAFMSDVRDLGYIIVFYVIVSRIFTRPRDYAWAAGLLTATVFLKTFIFLSRYLTGSGYVQGYGFNRALMGSDPTMVGFLLAMTVGLLFLFDSMTRKRKSVLLAAIAYETIILIAGMGRSTFVLTAASIVFLFYLFRKRLKLSMVLMALVVVAAGGFFFYYYMLTDVSRNMIGYALSSAFNWVEAIEVYGDMSMGQRILEAINIWGTLQHQGMVWLGMGWGSAWSEIIVHHPLDLGSFPLVEQMTGVHTKAHFDAVEYLLKLGLIVMPLLYFSFYRIFRKGLQQFRKETSSEIRWALMGCLLMIIIFAPNFIYFARLKFLLALAFAGIATMSYRLQSDEHHSSGLAHSDDAE